MLKWPALFYISEIQGYVKVTEIFRICYIDYILKCGHRFILIFIAHLTKSAKFLDFQKYNKNENVIGLRIHVPESNIYIFLILTVIYINYYIKYFLMILFL